MKTKIQLLTDSILDEHYFSEEQAKAWKKVWEQCIQLGMDMNKEKTGLDSVLTFIRDLRAKADKRPGIRPTHNIDGHEYMLVSSHYAELNDIRNQP